MKSMGSRMAAAAVAILAVVGWSYEAEASLIGDTIEFQISGSIDRLYIPVGGVSQVSESGVITYFDDVVAVDGGGPEVVYEIFGEDSGDLLATMSFDVFAEDIFVYFDVEVALTSGFSFVDFYSLDWPNMPGGALLDVQIINHNLPVNAVLVPFSVGPHQFQSDWSTPGAIGPGSYTVQYHLLTNHVPVQNPIVPEPMTLSLMGLGLAGAAWRTRKLRG